MTDRPGSGPPPAPADQPPSPTGRAARPGVRVCRLTVGDDPDAWASAGFHVVGEGVVSVGSLSIDLVGGDRRGLRSWSLWSPLPDAPSAVEDGRLDGLRTTLLDDPAPPAAAPAHPNGVTGLDHLVLVTPDVERTTAALAGVGLEPRRTRPTDQYGAPMVQRFFRAGPVILELVGPADPSPEGGRTRFYGLAFTVADLEAAAALLAPHVGRVKDAVQPGRRITTLRHRDLGISVPIALMSPEPSSARPGPPASRTA